MNTLLMYVRDSSQHKSVLFTYFILYNLYNLVCISSKQVVPIFTLNPQLFGQQIDKKQHL